MALSISLNISALFTGLGFCFYQKNPYQVLKYLNTQISELTKQKIQVSEDLKGLGDKELAIASLKAVEELIEQKHLELQEIEKQYRKQWDLKQQEINQQQLNNEKFLEEKTARN